MAEEKKLTEEELEQASGGKAFARRKDPNLGGTVVPNDGGGDAPADNNDGPTPSIGGVTPMDDPRHGGA